MATVTVKATASQLWVRSLRAPFLVASLIPMAAAVFLARLEQGRADLFLAALTAVGLGSIHVAVNMLNDNFDYRSGADLAVKHHNPFAGGSRVLLQGILHLRSHLMVALAFLGLGIAIGLYLVWMRGPVLLAIGLVGVVFGVFYVVPPLRFAHHGVGEVCVAIAFGPAIVLGTYYVQTGGLGVAPLILSIPFGLLVAAILWVNEFPDVEADEAAGKRTLVARLGRRRSVYVYGALLLTSYATVLLAVLGRYLPWPALLVFLSAPLALRAVRHLGGHYDHPHDIIPANATTILLLLAFGGLGILGLIVRIVL